MMIRMFSCLLRGPSREAFEKNKTNIWIIIRQDYPNGACTTPFHCNVRLLQVDSVGTTANCPFFSGPHFLYSSSSCHSLINARRKNQSYKR
jgi:hypothetical protein